MRKFKPLSFVFLFFVFWNGSSMYSAASWAKSFLGSLDEEALSVAVTMDGGYVIAGWTASFGATQDDLWVIKLDTDGNVEWEKTYAGKLLDRAASIQQTRDGGYIVGGFSKSWYPGRGVSVLMWVLKLDHKGNIQWEKAYGKIGCGFLRAIKQTHDGGYIIAGTAWDVGPKNRKKEILVLKLDPKGNMKWNKMYGGKGLDEPYDVIQTSDRGYVVVGITNSFGEKWGDYWVLKLDKYGNSLWQRTFGGDLEDRATSVVETSDRGYLVAGWTRSLGLEKYDINAWLVKLSRDGKIKWQKSYGDKWFNCITSVDATSDGGFVAAGSTNIWKRFADMWMLKVDGSGNVQWQRTYGGSLYEKAFSVKRGQDGGFVMGGWSESFSKGMHKDLIVLKANSSGMITGCRAGFVVGSLKLSAYDTSVIAKSTNAKPKILKIFSVKTKAKVRNTSARVNMLCR